MKAAQLIRSLVIVSLCTAAASASMINFSLKPTQQDVLIGQTTSVELWANSTAASTSVFGLQVIVSYDNTKLQFTSSLNDGTFDFEGAAPLNSALVWSGQNVGADASIPDSGVRLATLQFLALHEISSTSVQMLTTSGAIVTGAYDSSDADVPVILGAPVAIRVFTPEPASVLSLMLLAGCGLRRRQLA